MNKFKLFIIFLINIFLDISILPKMSIYGVAPYISIAIIVVLSMRAKNDKITYYAILLGFLLDIAYGSILGTKMLSFYLISYYTYTLRRYDNDTYSYGLLATVISVIVNEIYLYSINILKSGTFNFSVLVNYVIKFLSIELIINVVFYTILYFLVDRMMFNEKKKFFS